MDQISHFRDDVMRLGELGCILQGHRASQVHGLDSHPGPASAGTTQAMVVT